MRTVNVKSLVVFDYDFFVNKILKEFAVFRNGQTVFLSSSQNVKKQFLTLVGVQNNFMKSIGVLALKKNGALKNIYRKI